MIIETYGFLDPFNRCATPRVAVLNRNTDSLTEDLEIASTQVRCDPQSGLRSTSKTAAISLSPSKVKTEFILDMLAQGKMEMDPAQAESVRFSGRCVAALVADEGIISRSGGIYTVKELAEIYGFADPDHE